MGLGDAFRTMVAITVSSRACPPVPHCITKRLASDVNKLRNECTLMAAEKVGESLA